MDLQKEKLFLGLIFVYKRRPHTQLQLLLAIESECATSMTKS